MIDRTPAVTLPVAAQPGADAASPTRRCLVIDVQERLAARRPRRRRGSCGTAVGCSTGPRFLAFARRSPSRIPRSSAPPRRAGGAASRRRRTRRWRSVAAPAASVFAEWRAREVERVLLCGIETHVCVAQTAFDLLAAGYQVFVAADAVGTRCADRSRHRAAADRIVGRRASRRSRRRSSSGASARGRRSSGRSAHW